MQTPVEDLNLNTSASWVFNILSRSALQTLQLPLDKFINYEHLLSQQKKHVAKYLINQVKLYYLQFVLLFHNPRELLFKKLYSKPNV